MSLSEAALRYFLHSGVLAAIRSIRDVNSVKGEADTYPKRNTFWRLPLPFIVLQHSETVLL